MKRLKTPKLNLGGMLTNLGLVALAVVVIGAVWLFLPQAQPAVPTTPSAQPKEVQQPLKPEALKAPSGAAATQVFGQRPAEESRVLPPQPTNPIKILFFIAVGLIIVGGFVGLIAAIVLFSRFGEIPAESKRFIKQLMFFIQVDRGSQAYIENQITGKGRWKGPGTHLVLWPIEKVVALPVAEVQLPPIEQDVEFKDVEEEFVNGQVAGTVDAWLRTVLSVKIFDPALMVQELAESAFIWEQTVIGWAKGFIFTACGETTFPRRMEIIPRVKELLGDYLKERGIRVIEFQIQAADLADPEVKQAYSRRAQLRIRGDAEKRYREDVELTPALLVLSQAAESGLLGQTLTAILMRSLGVKVEAEEGIQDQIKGEREEELE